MLKKLEGKESIIIYILWGKWFIRDHNIKARNNNYSVKHAVLLVRLCPSCTIEPTTDIECHSHQ